MKNAIVLTGGKKDDMLMKTQGKRLFMLLTEPTLAYAQGIEDYRQAFLRINGSMDGSGSLRRCTSAEEWIEQAARGKDPATVQPGLVPATQYIYVRESDGQVVGMLQIRHCFNENLRKYGGHIGYSVRPDERRKGYATSMLKAALPRCRELGLSDVLITCFADNEGSRRTILHNGGVYESTVHEPELDRDLERYWIHL